MRLSWSILISQPLTLVLALASIGCQGPSFSSEKPNTDLTTQAWFPPISQQQGNSCAQQAAIYYLLTAERNRALAQSSALPAQRLSPYQTYAILADSMAGGTHVTDGWSLAQETGVPLESDLPRGSRRLMHGFQKYLDALRQKPASWQLLPLRRETDLPAVKAALASGHLLACDFQVRGAKLSKRPDGTTLVSGWSRTGPGHSMIYAGYDDTIGLDCNGDGQITNDLDITGDGRITLADHERGAFLVVNPWGARWGTGGKAWSLYREHALTPWPRAGEVALVQAAPSTAPRRMLKLSLFLKERRSLLLTVSDDSRTLEPLPFRRTPLPFSHPASVSPWEIFGKVHRPGPPISLGSLANPSGGPLEMGFDLSVLQGSSIQLKLSSSGGPLQGILHAAALVELDAQGRTRRETPFPGLPVALSPNGGSWTATR